jgi:hypothetical protein
MPPNRKKKRLLTSAFVSPDIGKKVSVQVLEQLMRVDLSREKLNKPVSGAYDRVKQEISDAEEALDKIKTKKGKGKRKASLNATITQKKKWLSDVDDVESKNFLTLWTAMFQGYQVDLVINQTEHVKKQGLVVRAANEEFEKRLRGVIQQNIKITGKSYSAGESKGFKRILNRFALSIKLIVIEEKSEITSQRIKRLLSGNDLTIEHNCVGHAIYTQIYKQGTELVIVHCNRGNGQRSNYNLVYRINIAGLDADKLRTAIETITGLDVVKGNEEHYKTFYDLYDKTLKDLGCSFSFGKHVKSQKIGNCAVANIKGLLKERLPNDVYKWCTTEMRNQSNIQHLISPMLQSGKNIKDKHSNIDTDDDFFHLRQLINYILEKSVEGVVNGYFGNIRKSESIKSAFKAIEDYEGVLDSNHDLSDVRRAAIKKYIYSKISIHKEISNNAEMQKPDLFYQLLLTEAEKVVALSTDDESQKEFFKHLISKVTSNPNFFSDFYDYFSREKTGKSISLLKMIFSQSTEIILGDSVLNDPENIVAYQGSLRKILLKECEKIPCDEELITTLTDMKMTNVDPSVYSAAYAMMKDRESDENKYVPLKLLLDSTFKSGDFLDLFVRKKTLESQTSSFFKPKKQAHERLDLSSFFKAAAEFVIENTKAPLTQGILRLNIERMIPNVIERTADKHKVKRFLELFCYKQLLDSKIIKAENISLWNDLSLLANQCKQINYCLPDALEVASDVLDSCRKLKSLVKSRGKDVEQLQSLVCYPL